MSNAPLAYEAAFAPALLDAERPVPAHVVAHTGDPVVKRFAVYRNNVVVGLVDALRVRFPVIEKLVGDEFFAAMARVFVTECPPRSPLMMVYGDAFPDFLERFPPALELPYLPDVARLEAARTRAYHAADAPSLDTTRLSGLPPEDVATLRLTLHPSASVLRSAHPVVTIWAMNSGERPLAPIEDWHGEDALVARPDHSVEVYDLAPGGAAFLQALMAGETLAAAASAGAAQSPAFELATQVSLLIGRGLVTDAAIARESPQ